MCWMGNVMASSMLPPELLMLIGVNVFVALSLVTSIFDHHFPVRIPYVFQIAALAGFGLIWWIMPFSSLLLRRVFGVVYPF